MKRLLNRLLFPLRLFLLPYTQCCALLEQKNGGGAYCIRTRGHFGLHRTYCGEKFAEGKSGDPQ